LPFLPFPNEKAVRRPVHRYSSLRKQQPPNIDFIKKAWKAITRALSLTYRKVRTWRKPQRPPSKRQQTPKQPPLRLHIGIGQNELDIKVTWLFFIVLVIIIALIVSALRPAQIIAEADGHPQEPPKVAEIQPIKPAVALKKLKPLKPIVIKQKASPAPSVRPTGNCALWLEAAGVTDTNSAMQLINRESGCNPYAVNASSGACGVGQALPCSKTGCAMGDGYCQVEWMDGYVKSRYGTWAAALSHSLNYNWY